MDTGEQMTIADVARTLGIPPQSIYQYFRSIDDLFIAAASDDSEAFVAQLTSDLRGMTNPADVVIEGIAKALERLPDQPFVGAVLRQQPDVVARAVTSEAARIQLLSVWRDLLGGMDSRRHDASESREFAEIVLRTFQSLIFVPSYPSRTGAELRSFLRKWLAPVIDACGMDTSTGCDERMNIAQAMQFQLGVLRDSLNDDDDDWPS